MKLGTLLLTLGLLVPLAPAAASLQELTGTRFPDLEVGPLLEPADYAQLGLARDAGVVRLSEIPGDLLILEFMNRFCITCWQQAPQLQSFLELRAGADLGQRVRVLAVAAGNDAQAVGWFRNQFGLTLPLAPDPEFAAYYAAGDPGGMPGTAFLVREEGQWVLAEFHVGFYPDVALAARARVLLKGGPGAAPPAPRGSAARPRTEPSPEEVARFLGGLTGREMQVETLDSDAGGALYRGTREDGDGAPLFVRYAARDPLCDLCHPIRFLLAFDAEGTVLGFEPLFVTKFGNEPWSAADTRTFRAIVSGKTARDAPFRPSVDAVTSATMSSALIFDEIRRAATYLRAAAP